MRLILKRLCFSLVIVLVGCVNHTDEVLNEVIDQSMWNAHRLIENDAHLIKLIALESSRAKAWDSKAGTVMQICNEVSRYSSQYQNSQTEQNWNMLEDKYHQSVQLLTELFQEVEEMQNLRIQNISDALNPSIINAKRLELNIFNQAAAFIEYATSQIDAGFACFPTNIGYFNGAKRTDSGLEISIISTNAIRESYPDQHTVLITLDSLVGEKGSVPLEYTKKDIVPQELFNLGLVEAGEYTLYYNAIVANYWGIDTTEFRLPLEVH